jgi:hypothetical protein
MEMSSTPVSEIQIITKNNAISIDEYKSMVKFLRHKYKKKKEEGVLVFFFLAKSLFSLTLF